MRIPWFRLKKVQGKKRRTKELEEKENILSQEEGTLPFSLLNESEDDFNQFKNYLLSTHDI